MNRRKYYWLILILPLLALALLLDLNTKIKITNPITKSTIVDKNIDLKLGLDLRGGLQTLMEADLPATTAVSADDLNVAKQIMENRSNALGVSEVIMQVAPPRRIVAEFPGITNPQEVIASLQQTGMLEFIDLGDTRLPAGTIVTTDFGNSGISSITSSGQTVYHTIMTGTALSSVRVDTTSTGAFVISFVMKSDYVKQFSDYTGSNLNKIMGIALDKKILSSLVIKAQITDGKGVFEGNFTNESANALAIQLRYGALPFPLKIIENRQVGPTLGEKSIKESELAGIIGLSAVILFMIGFYRLPGLIADLALLVYASVTIMLFKLIPVVLTLPGIAGFILSIGMAVDANILIFERLKEELRAGRPLSQAIDLGWKRAWPSIRDSNFSTLITCVVLYIFGNTFGASMVKGFSVTLAIGVLVSLFTATIVTRTFLHVVLDNFKFAEHPRWFGVRSASK